MSTNLILTLIAFVVITSYIVGITIKHGVLPSISDSNYLLQRKWGWSFEATMFICGGLISYIGHLESNILFMIGGIGIIMVGIFSRFKRNRFIMLMHSIGAIGGLICTMSGFVQYFGFTLTLLLMVPTGAVKVAVEKNTTFWVEVVAIYSIFLGFIIHLT